MRELVLENDPILRKPSVPFDFDNPQEDPEKLTEELLTAMQKYEGMGLSACQIGIDLKVFVMRFDDDAIACFNPRIVEYSPQTTYISEGCLSFPGLFFPVERAYGVFTEYYSKDGVKMGGTFVNITAKCFQHEYDHMLGRLYIDGVSNFKLKNARKKQVLWKRKNGRIQS
tara:strand:+ start:1293 stop:1802 length:510 start_codon:yes stop_codon:yes gene_type:complete